MAKSKKPKPSFDEPTDAKGPSDTGWVYRSEAPAPPAPPAPRARAPKKPAEPPVVEVAPVAASPVAPSPVTASPVAASPVAASPVAASPVVSDGQAGAGSKDVAAPPPPARAEPALPGKPDPKADRDAAARKIVDRHVMYAAAVGLVPIPIIDAAAITGLQVSMVRSLAEHYGVPFSRDRGKALVTALVGGVAPAAAGKSVARFLVKSVPIAGPVFHFVTEPALASASTYAVGGVFAAHFASGGTLDNLDVDGSRQKMAQATA